MATDARSAHEEALAKLPLDKLLHHYGMGLFDPSGRTPSEIRREKCPFCDRQGKFSVKKLNSGRWVFGCWHSDCPAKAPLAGKDEIGLVALKEGLPDRRSAFKRYLELADVRIERAATSGSGSSQSAQKPTTTPERDVKVIQFPKGGGTEPPDPKNIWGVLHSRLILNGEDRKKLREKRGLSDAAIDELGFRSNNLGNREIIEQLRELFPIHQLIDCGLYDRDPRTSSPRPNRQFTGWGITGEKTVNDDGEEEDVWGATHPILIPYLDATHRVVFMRPHKGNIAKRDKLSDEECIGHLYCPHLIASRIDAWEGLCVLTESEFKAAALWQAGFAAIGIPGVSFVKNPIFRQELVDTLQDFNVTELVVIFDNEVKDNPRIGKYIADPWKRHWPTVYARYLAWDLMKPHGSNQRPHGLKKVRIGRLPNEWRIGEDGQDRGKIDWDTALADFVSRARSVEKGTEKARKEFLKVIDAALPPNESDSLFTENTQDETIIKKLLKDQFHHPALQHGGEKHRKLAQRFDKINGSSPTQYQQWARELAGSLRDVVGTYFVRKEPTDKFRATLQKAKSQLNDNIEHLEKSTGPDILDKLDSLRRQRRLITEKLVGTPEPVSNFTASCEYVLHTIDRESHWMVNFKNIEGESTGLVRVPGDSLGRLTTFRPWCLTKARGVPVWFGGEKDLQSLMRDLKHLSAGRNIYEVSHYGFHPESKLWFFATSAYAPGDKSLYPDSFAPANPIMPDENNIYWHGGVGYMIQCLDEVGEGFHQGAPDLIPKKIKTEPDPAAVFQMLTENAFDCIGDYDAYLAIGMMLSYGAMPELFRDHGARPGLWIYGKRGSGKTQFARRLMRIWGFAELGGTRLNKSTPVGLQRSLAQYSCLPDFFDEYRRTIPDVESKEDVFRGAYDGSTNSKGRYDSSNQTHSPKALTMPMVVGENSSSDGACRSRFSHILVSENRRRDNEAYARLMKSADQLYVLGRYIMEHRAQFAAGVIEELDTWIKHSSIGDERTKLVHGVGYASFMTLASMLGTNANAKGFADYLTEHATQAFEDVLEETMINKFWQDVISALIRGEIERRFFEERQITLDKESRYNPSAIELAGAPEVRVCIIAAQPVFDMYSLDIKRRGLNFELSKNDIGRELSKEHYWIGAAGSQRVHRIMINSQRHVAWVINLEKFPFGEELSDAIEGKPAYT